MTTRLLMHPERAEALVVRRDGALERLALGDPSPLARLDPPDDRDRILCAGDPGEQIDVLSGSDSHSIDLSDWDDLSPLARMKLGRSCSAWTALTRADHAGWLLGADDSGTVHLIDRDRARHHVSQLDGMRGRAVSLHTGGRWAAALLSDPNRGTVRLWRLGEQPSLHARSLDLRHSRSPILSLAGARGDLAFDAPGELLFSYLSCSSLSHYPDGWRATVTAHETDSGRLVWAAEIDGQITGDWRPIDDLEMPGGALPTELVVTRAGRSLALGSSRGTVIWLDPRDGALQHVHHTGSPHPITHLAHAHDASLWALTSLGALLPIPDP